MAQEFYSDGTPSRTIDDDGAAQLWQPIATAPRDDYVTILVAVPRYEERELTHRFAMWDPENGDWTVFGANWNPSPVFWMPLVECPPMPDDVVPTMISDRLLSREC